MADSECQHIANSLCKENVCQCNLEEYVTSEDDKRCLKKAKSVGDECENDKQCDGIEEAVCSESKCVKAPLRGQILGKLDFEFSFRIIYERINFSTSMS